MIGVWPANSAAVVRARDFAKENEFVVLEDFGGLNEELYVVVYDAVLAASPVQDHLILKKFSQFQLKKVLIVGDSDGEPYTVESIEFVRVRFDNETKIKEYLQTIRESNEGFGSELKA